MSPLLLVVIIVLITLTTLWIVFRFLGQISAQRANAIGERYPQASAIIAGANFFGQESRGVTQMRGNGTLALTDSEIYFEMLFPLREFRIPLSSVQSVEITTWHLGKSVGRPLLKVVFRSDTGETDSMAWYVPDAVGLKQTLESLLG